MQKVLLRVIKESYTELGKNGDINSKAVVKAVEILTGKSKFEVYQQKDFKNDAAKVLKNYALINTILKNLPNAGKDVLKNDGKVFTGYASDALIQPYSGHESRKSLELYSKLSITDAQVKRPSS